MSSHYNPDQDIPDLTGKIFLVTGGTTGLGKSTTLQLAKHNPKHVYFTGRNAQAAGIVIAEAKAASTDATFIPCDLTSLSSVSQAAKKFLKLSEGQLDVLICNAGVMAVPPAVSKDGYEIQFAINHLAHALLMKLCLPALQRTANEKGDARIVSLTSLAFKSTPKNGIIFKDLKSNQSNLGMTAKFALYGQSKLANVLYASEFAKRYPQVTTASVHPGVIFNTALANHIGLVERLIIKAYCFNLKHFDSHEGAYNTLWAATTSDKKILESGGVYEPVGKPVAASKYSSDSAIAAELWAWTDEALANVS